MAEQTFRSPGFFEREIDLSGNSVQPTGTPAGVIGTSEKGPAFIPVTIADFNDDFVARFGDLDPNRAGPYAVKQYLEHKDAVTFMRVLGAGSNDTTSEIDATRNYGIVSKAGFKVAGTAQTLDISTPVGHNLGCPQFLVAKHYISASVEGFSFPEFTDNSSFPNVGAGDNTVNLLRAVIFPTTGSRICITSADGAVTDAAVAGTAGQQTQLLLDDSKDRFKKFRIIVSSSAGTGFSNDDSLAGCRIYTASLNPTSDDYIARILNTDPSEFQTQQHLLYLDFAVEDELAPVQSVHGVTNNIAICSGSGDTNSKGGQSDVYGDSFGRFDTRYTTPRTPYIISQPYGTTEYNLFYLETISDGAYSNDKVKASIANLRASTDKNNPFCSFELQIRRFGDTDEAKEIIESFPNVNLNPNDERFVAKVVGDYKPRFNFDSTDLDEQRIVVSGKYPNVSRYVRLVMHKDVYDGKIPRDAMPFGFRGIPVLKTMDTLTDSFADVLADRDGVAVGEASVSSFTAAGPKRLRSLPAAVQLTGSIVPPLPLRFKVTKGNVHTAAGPYVGYPSNIERADSRLYWGVKFERTADSASVTNAGLNPNAGSLPNATVGAYTKFQGLAKLDNLVTGSGADLFHDNKFTLARVALSTQAMANLTGSAGEHMLEAAYLRNKYPEAKTYTIDDGISGAESRFTLATLVASSSVKFNRFTNFAKFTLPFYGGFDGLNILDQDIRFLNDKGSATDTGGKAADSITHGLGLKGTNDGSLMGKGPQNNSVFSYNKAIRIMTDPLTIRHNLLAIPGIRDPYITDTAMQSVKDYAMAMYVMDIQHYDEDGNRLFTDDPKRPDVRETSEQFEGRRVDNNYTATYFPDVFVDDSTNNRPVFVPSSVAAYGALANSDSVSFPWFAPAGFTRGALGFVRNTEVRLTSGDRDDLYDARINPIANFPNGGFVIFGQKTLQINRSALDRVNVRRMLLEVKRRVVGVAEQLLFEPNNSNTRSRFVSQVTPILALIQSQSGIEKFSVVMDDTNNAQEDIDQNRLNGRIVVVPTRAIEFIAIDFVVTNAGVEFA